jgi:hypothetical protein
MVWSSKMKQSYYPTSCSSDLRPVNVVTKELAHLRLTDSRTVNPWIIQVALSTFNEEDLKFVVQIGQPSEVLVLTGEWERRHKRGTNLPATTHPQLPPPHTIISTSSGTVILSSMNCFEILEVLVFRIGKWRRKANSILPLSLWVFPSFSVFHSHYNLPSQQASSQAG